MANNKDTQSTAAPPIGPLAACELAKEFLASGVTIPTMIAWCKRYGFGRKVGGRWQIDKDRLMQFLREGNLSLLSADKERR